MTRQRPSSAPPTSRHRVSLDSQAALLHIQVIPAAAEQLLALPSPGLTPDQQLAEKRAIVEKIVEKSARLRIFELSMQIEAEPHHLLQEALISHEQGMSDAVRDLLLCYENVAAAALHAQEAVESLTDEDVLAFQLPSHAAIKAKRTRQYRSPSVINITTPNKQDDTTPQPSPQQFWSHAGLRH